MDSTHIFSPSIIDINIFSIGIYHSCAKDAITNPQFHGVSQVIYEFTSSSANNGSGFEGLKDNTVFWNISTAIVMLVARYIPIVLQLLIVSSLVNKKTYQHTDDSQDVPINNRSLAPC